MNLLDIEKIKTFIFPSNLRATFSSIFSSMTFLSYPFTKYLPYILGYILPLQSLNFLGDGARAHFYHNGGHFIVRILSFKKFILHKVVEEDEEEKEELKKERSSLSRKPERAA